MDKLYEFGLLAFTSPFTMVNPLGVIPVYTTMTKILQGRKVRRIIVMAVLIFNLCQRLFYI